MTTKVYGLDKCDTCKKARNWLDRKQVAHEFIDYREHRVAPATLK
ncbi:MAG: glutaredoxin domain-containing protein, partial [Dokdonella sp.]